MGASENGRHGDKTLRLTSVLIAVLSLALACAVLVAPHPRATHAGWPTNSAGLTYGSAADAVSPDSEPDLIWVEATNGMTGYAYRTDLEGPDPSSPAEALRRQKARAGSARSIPVYLADGKTRIGVFIIEQ